MELHHVGKLSRWLIPFITEHGSIFSKNGSYVMWPVRGVQPQVIPEPLRYFLAAATFVGLFAWMVSLTCNARTDTAPVETDPISWRHLFALTVPFSLVYVFLLTPSLFRNLLIDRYVIPLEMMALPLLLRYYQQRMQPLLPRFLLPVVLVIAAYSVAATHDSFAMYRAVLFSANEARAAGIPRDRIDAGWEYDGWTQILEGGYVHQDSVRVPGGGAARRGPDSDRVCFFVISPWLPDVHPLYTLSLTPDDCGGASGLAPVVYHRWLAPRTMTIYVVKDPAGNGTMTDYDNTQ